MKPRDPRDDDGDSLPFRIKSGSLLSEVLMKDVHALTPTDFNGIVTFGPRRYTIEVFTGNPWGDHVLFAASATIDGGVLRTAYFEKAAIALSAVLHAIAECEAPDLLSPGRLE